MEFADVPRLTCSAETRFQGIATTERISAEQAHPVTQSLQCRDPFSGDCDSISLGRRNAAAFPPTLQCRDPFSGDCDPQLKHASTRITWFRLQCQDPFSGDCDNATTAPIFLVPTQETCSAETRFQGIATGQPGASPGDPATVRLAALRPVFRGLRRGVAKAQQMLWAHGLAVPRPVFRGLRPWTPAPTPRRWSDVMGKQVFKKPGRPSECWRPAFSSKSWTLDGAGRGSPCFVAPCAR